MAEFVCLFAWLTHFRANQPFSSFFQSVFFPGHNEAAPEIQWEPETALHNHGFQFSMTPRKWSVPLLYIIYIILCIIWFTFQSFSIITYLTCFFSKNISLHLGEQVDTNVSSMGGPSTNQSGSNKIISENHQR